MLGRDPLTADEIRNIDEDSYLIIDLHEDEYWEQGEGRVEFVKEYDSGEVHIGISGSWSHSSRLRVPADARKSLKFDGAANGANGLRVDAVYHRQ
jgi:hypothetical protein